MLTGKYASIHICDKTIKIAEGIVSRGRVEIRNAATIANANRFFNQNGRLINMSSLVETVVMTMASCGITAKKLFVGFDSGMVETVFSTEPITHIKRKSLSDINISFGRKDPELRQKEELLNSATITRRHVWGQYVTQEDQGEAVSVTRAERDMVESLTTEFSKHGFKVISAEGIDTAMVYTRNSVAYSYDSLCKLIIHADNDETGTLYIMIKDVPATIKRIPFDTLEGYSLQDRIREVCLREMNSSQMRNPYVYLLGDAFDDIDVYVQIAQDLEAEGLQVIDLYGMNQEVEQIPNSIQVCISKDADPSMPELTSVFGVCISLLFRCYEDKPINLCDSHLPMMIPAQAGIIGAKVVQAAAAVFLIANVLLTGLTGFEAISVHKQLMDSSSLRTQLNQTEAKRDEARLYLSVLNTIDHRIIDAFTFLHDNVDASVNIASIDTIDMIPSEEDSTSIYSSNAESGAMAPVETQASQQLVIRGYSIRSNGSIELLNALQNANVGHVRLVGHQQLELPSGETIYVFELRAGEDVG